ncbi:MAG TPA: hypothetical protein VFB80_05875, partial [Pirellulaceae bacterium]|nr:hypothetical protein [Pirellulaceae bacterium]
MASGTVPSVVPPPIAESLQREQVIQRQLGRTSLHVRLIDLASGLAFWLVGVVVFFIAAAAFDHLIGLGTIGRVLGLVMLVAGSAWYLVAVIWPLVARSINPEYAARTIEEATPSLKNSLINFLMLRSERGKMKEIVFQALEQKAASDIAGVPVESTVDRTALIRAGYVLCGVMALFAGYKILSPKDPFQTVARVLAPWAEIARPSRVQITDVQPGHAEVYHGQTATISAIVSGVRGGDPVTLLVSTADGQTIDQPVEMTLAAGGLRYECVLPSDGKAPSGRSAGRQGEAQPFAGPSSGLQQDVTYRIVAGDAESPLYKLTVVAAPTIIVERLEYQYPAYTKKPAEKVEQQGDIKGLEGTRVTIQAIANQPIKSAWIEFDPGSGAAPQLVTLAAEGSRAWGTITLELQRDRQTPWHQHYQVRFRNERAQRSEQPILHKIEVLRDLAPEVQILQPQSLRVEVPENGEQLIEVRALDPDFGLSAVRLEGAVANKPPLKIDLLPPQARELPQVTVPFAFRPQEHKLAAGDELKYVAVAEDNRTNSVTGQPEPNVSRTKEYTLVVVPPAPQQNNQGQGGQNNPQQDQQPKNQEPKNQDPKNQEPKNQDPKNQNPQDQKNQKPMNQGAGAQQQPMGGQQQQPMGGQQQQPMGGQQQQPMGGQGQQQNGGQGSPMNGGAGGQQGGDPQQANPMAGGAAGNRTNQGNPSGQPAGNDAEPAGQQGDPNATAGGQQTGTGGKPAGKAHDGEAIQEALKDLQRRGQQPDGSQQPQPNGGQQNPAGGQPMPNTNQQNPNGQGQTGERQPAAGEQGGQPQNAGNSGNQGQNTQTTGTPAPNEAQRNAAGQEQQGKGAREGGQKAKASDRLPDEQKGSNPSRQPGDANKGGTPMGPNQTQQQPKSKA